MQQASWEENLNPPLGGGGLREGGRETTWMWRFFCLYPLSIPMLLTVLRGHRHVRQEDDVTVGRQRCRCLYPTTTPLPGTLLTTPAASGSTTHFSLATVHQRPLPPSTHQLRGYSSTLCPTQTSTTTTAADEFRPKQTLKPFFSFFLYGCKEIKSNKNNKYLQINSPHS